MGNFRQKMTRFLYGRYGTDQLSKTLFWIGVSLFLSASILNMLGSIEPVCAIIAIALDILSLCIMTWTIFRFFSRNIPARRRENAAWLRLRAKFRRKPKPRLPADTADHIFRTCPHCSSTLRLPRRVGKHEARCPRCNKCFQVKVKK